MSFRVKQIIVLVLLLVFVVFINLREHYVNVDIQTVKAELEKEESIKTLTDFPSTEIKKDYGFNVNDYGEAFYFGLESIMDCDSVLLIKLYDEKNGGNIISAINNKNEELKKLFQSYAPDQYTILNNCVLEQKGQYVIYIVSEDAKNIEKIILKKIKG